MARFDVGDRVKMPGVSFVVEVLELGTCDEGDECPFGPEVFRFKDPGGNGDDWEHASMFERAAGLMVEDTTRRDPELHLLGMLGQGQTGYIEDMEAAGGQQFAADAELMPACGPWRELVALGFAEPQPTDDQLFVRTRLPKGWTKRTLDDPRGGEVLDERGLARVGTFYKAARYDRKADCHLIAPGLNLATEGIYGDAPPGRPALWDVMTADERQDYLGRLNGYLKDAKEYPDIYGDRVKRVRALKAAVDRG